ncbi:hypothetical protein [Streptomyces sp. NPDC004788]
MAGSGGGGGLYALMAGVWMECYGVVVATNFRGAAHRMHAMSTRSVSFGEPFWRRPPGVRFVRVLAGVFALMGPLLLFLGVRQVGRGEALTDSPPMPLPFALFMLVGVALAVWGQWRRGSWLRREWSAGARRHRVAAVMVTGGFLGFAAGLGLGLQLLWVSSWSLAAGASLYLLVAGRADRQDSRQPSARATPTGHDTPVPPIPQ